MTTAQTRRDGQIGGQMFCATATTAMMSSGPRSTADADKALVACHLHALTLPVRECSAGLASPGSASGRAVVVADAMKPPLRRISISGPCRTSPSGWLASALTGCRLKLLGDCRYALPHKAGAAGNRASC